MHSDFLGLLRALDREQVEHVVVGGVAAILGGAPVATIDLDIVYRLTEQNVDRLARALSKLEARYWDPAGREILPTPDKLLSNRVNLLSTRSGLLDVRQEIGDRWRYDEVLERSDRYEVADLAVRVLSLESVIASKQAAGRDKDRAMLPVLLHTLELLRAGLD